MKPTYAADVVLENLATLIEGNYHKLFQLLVKWHLQNIASPFEKYQLLIQAICQQKSFNRINFSSLLDKSIYKDRRTFVDDILLINQKANRRFKSKENSRHQDEKLLRDAIVALRILQKNLKTPDAELNMFLAFYDFRDAFIDMHAMIFNLEQDFTQLEEKTVALDRYQEFLTNFSSFYQSYFDNLNLALTQMKQQMSYSTASIFEKTIIQMDQKIRAHIIHLQNELKSISTIKRAFKDFNQGVDDGISYIQIQIDTLNEEAKKNPKNKFKLNREKKIAVLNKGIEDLKQFKLTLKQIESRKYLTYADFKNQLVQFEKIMSHMEKNVQNHLSKPKEFINRLTAIVLSPVMWFKNRFAEPKLKGQGLLSFKIGFHTHTAKNVAAIRKQVMSQAKHNYVLDY